MKRKATSRLKTDAWAKAMSVIRRMGFTISDFPCTTKELQTVADGFQRNIISISHLADLPTFAFIMGRNYQKCETHACLKKTGHAFPDNPMEPSDEIQKLTVEFFRGGHPDRPTVGASGTMSHTYEQMGIGFQDGFVLLATFQIVAVWTLCETLFGDLWEAAVNSQPILSKMDKKLKKEDKDPFDLFKEKADRTVHVSCLAEHRFKIANKMGTMFREQEIVSFTNIWNVRDAYNRTFGNKKQIRDAITHPSLGALSVVRNAIIHKAGRWDEESVKQAAAPKVKRLLPKITPGSRVKVDGALLSRLLPDAVACCIHLIRHVDTIVTHNSKRKTRKRKR